MRDPAGPPAWLMIGVGLLWAFAVGVWRERNRLNGSKDLADDVKRVTAERDRARDELEQRRCAAMPTLRLVHGGQVNLTPAGARAVNRALRELRDGVR